MKSKIEELKRRKLELKIKKLELEIDKLMLELTPVLRIPSLNSQDQEEYERGFSDGMAEEERDNIKFEKWNENERKKREILIRDTLNNGFELHYTKDTPEEWEKEFDGLLTRYIGGEKKVIDLIEFIEQLLSERSFSKEELEWIKNCVECYGEEVEVNEDHSKIENAILDKVDRLLNLNNKKK